MTQGVPRIAPVPEAEWTQAMGSRTAEGHLLNGQMTFARHPSLRSVWSPLATYIRNESTLLPRHRELAILRTGYHHHAEYEFSQHVGSGRSAGLSEEDLQALLAETVSDNWDFSDAAVIHATDELFATSSISDSTWDALNSILNEYQLFDLLFTVGMYATICYATNALHIQVDDFVANSYPWLS